MKSSHEPLRIWLVIVLGSLLFSGAALTLGPALGNAGLTGFAIYTNEKTEFSPPELGQEQYLLNLYAALGIIFLLLILQVGVYLFVTSYYKDEEEDMPPV